MAFETPVQRPGTPFPNAPQHFGQLAEDFSFSQGLSSFLDAMPQSQLAHPEPFLPVARRLVFEVSDNATPSLWADQMHGPLGWRHYESILDSAAYRDAYWDDLLESTVVPVTVSLAPTRLDFQPSETLQETHGA